MQGERNSVLTDKLYRRKKTTFKKREKYFKIKELKTICESKCSFFTWIFKNKHILD